MQIFRKLQKFTYIVMNLKVTFICIVVILKTKIDSYVLIKMY